MGQDSAKKIEKCAKKMLKHMTLLYSSHIYQNHHI